jgi:hypothetical protein
MRPSCPCCERSKPCELFGHLRAFIQRNAVAFHPRVGIQATVDEPDAKMQVSANAVSPQ